MIKTNVPSSVGIGERVRSARLSLGLSQAQMAENCGLSVPYISRIEQGKGNPTIAALGALAEALSVPLVELVAGAPGADEAPASRPEPTGNSAAPPTGDGVRGDGVSAGGSQGSYVPKGLRVERTDLLAWADTEGAGLKLPGLVRLLIRETAPNSTRARFPSGTGAQSGGWDGWVECDEAHPYVPKGRSGWELSTDRNTQRKAISDYEKRRDGVPAGERAAMAYVAVICRPWTKARQFEEQRAADGDFREVRAFNVDDLVDWLAEAPEATTWLREEMGQPVDGVEPLRQWWEEWLESTRTPLGESVVLAGRRETAEKLRRACAAGGIVTVGGSIYLEETLAFIAAALTDTEGGSEGFGDALHVADRDTARRLLVPSADQSNSGTALTLVVDSTDTAKGLSPKRPQCVVVPVPGSDDTDVVVEGIDIAEASEALRAQGLDHDEAWKLARLGRRNLLTLRRHLARKPELHRPSWANEGDPVLRRCLLLGCWDGSHEGDRAAVERFCESTYPSIEEKLEKLLGDSEPPLVRVGTRWHTVSQAGAFQAIGGRFQQAEFSELAKLAAEVLGEHDPLAGLHGAELVQAQVGGIAAAHSNHLKNGLAGSLAILAERRECLTAGVQGIVGGSVARLLSSANSSSEPSRWHALAQHLPALAESAPDEFLKGVRIGMADESSPLVQALLESNEDPFEVSMGRFRSQLVAALDVLAWSPDHLPAAADLLAELAERDEEEGIGGQAAEALRGTMCYWMPNTSATLDTRMAVLKSMHDRHPDAAWRTAASMLPSPGSSKTDGHTPRFHTWKAGRKTVTFGERYEAVSRVSVLMISWASSDPNRYADLIADCGRLFQPNRVELLRELRGLAESADEQVRAVLWHALRDMVVRHRRFNDAQWALPPAEISDFEALMTMFEPQSASDRHRWLFQPGAGMLLDELSPYESDFQARDTALRERQTEAVAGIHSEGGTRGVLQFAASVEAPRDVGAALAGALPPGCDELMGAELANGNLHIFETAWAYFSARFRQDGWTPIDSQISASSSPEAIAGLLRASRDPKGAWERLDEMDEAVRDKYWETLTESDVPFNQDLEVEVARRLGHAGRPVAAINLLANYSYRFVEDPEYARAAAELLMLLAEQGTRETTQLAYESVTSLLEAIDRHAGIFEEEEIAEIEWAYLPSLGWHAKTPRLHKMLSEDPDFFARVVEVAHPNRSELHTENSEDHESRRRLAAYGLLHEMPVSPGLDQAGRIDAFQLRDWVSRARTLLTDAGCLEMGDVAIGTALAAAPTNQEGVPDPAVCDVIENTTSEDLEAGYSTAIFNNRSIIGFSSDGGRQKYRALEGRYRAISRQLSHKWHRTASIYNDLASSYQHFANDRDTPHESRQAGFDY